MKLARLKVVQMRKELEGRGLDSSGTRPTLMRRLREAMEKEEQEGSVNAGDGATDKNDNASIPSNQNSAVQNERREQRTENGIAQEASVAQQPNDADQHQPSDPVQPVETTDPSDSVSMAAMKATGSLQDASAVSFDERMKQRRERFGAAKDETPEEAAKRRRARFGLAKEETPEEAAKRRRGRFGDVKTAIVDVEKAKEQEILEKRASKFGLNASAKQTKRPVEKVSAEEEERRLKRQRRFEKVGTASS